jgi:hypothetical protein
VAPGKLVRAEAVSLAQCLGHLGVGMEPDVRFGGPPLIARRVVLFREEPGKHLATASREYTAAMTLLHLAVAVGAADGSVSDDEIAHLIGHLESGLGLAAAERRRLTAHLRWLVAAGVKLTGPKKGSRRSTGRSGRRSPTSLSRSPAPTGSLPPARSPPSRRSS